MECIILHDCTAKAGMQNVFHLSTLGTVSVYAVACSSR